MLLGIPAYWWLFNFFILIMLILDLGVLHRKAEEVSVRSALWQSAMWIVLALLFGVLIFWWRGPETALEYYAGYLIEKALSVDNLFVFLLLFSFFAVPKAYQYRVLFWGVIGALVMRALFIFAGVALLERFHWLIYIFGAFLIYTAFRMIRDTEHEVHPERNPALRLVRRLLPMTDEYVGDKFFIRRAGRLMATPLFVVLVVVETSDVIFALDSIPAILAITRDPFIVYSSNAFAILGLRALFFALAGLLVYIEYLDYGLSAVLAFIGLKMLLPLFEPLLTQVLGQEVHLHIPVGWALLIVALLIGLSVVASFVLPPRESRRDIAEMAEGDQAGPAGEA